MPNHHLPMPVGTQYSKQGVGLSNHERRAKTCDDIRECNKGKRRPRALHNETDGLKCRSGSNSLEELD